MSKLAFVSLGEMDCPPAAHLARKGSALTVCDIAPQNAARMAEAGMTTASDSAEAVLNADVVLAMLPATAHVRTVVQDKGCVLGLMKPGGLLST